MLLYIVLFVVFQFGILRMIFEVENMDFDTQIIALFQLIVEKLNLQIELTLFGDVFTNHH